MILLQYLHIQSDPTHLSVRDQDTASISPHSIPSYTHICQRPGCCFDISTFYPILLTYLPETRILFQYLHNQSHLSHLSVRDHDYASISPHSIPSYTPICQKPWYCFNISTFNPILHTHLSETRILLQYLHIQSHPTHPSVRDKDAVPISPHSMPSFTSIIQRPWYCFNISTFNPILHIYHSETLILLNISTFNPILHTYHSETMILLQYPHIQFHPTHLYVRDHDTVSISPHSIPSFTPICHRPGYCFNISTCNPILLTYLSDTMILLQHLHIQSHPTHIFVRDHDTVSISPHSIPSFTPICQSPGFCFSISTFSPILNTYLSETGILLQYLHIQSHPTHLSVRDQKTGSTSPHSISHYAPVSIVKSKYCFHIQSRTTLLWVLDHDTVWISPHLVPSFTPICQRPGYCFNISTFNYPTHLSVRSPWYCFNISTFNPILHTYLSETMILLQYLHIKSHRSHLSVRDHDTASISPYFIPSYTPFCQIPWYCFNISTFNPTLHIYLSETRILLRYLHILSHPTHISARDQDTVSISPQPIPSFTPICQRPW